MLAIKAKSRTPYLYVGPICVAMFLAAIIAANMAVTTFGPAALPFTAFILIPFDLATRDVLHDRWSDTGLVLRMGALILAGGILSVILNADTSRIAAASFVAFSSATTLDALIYHRLRYKTRLVRLNTSNAVGAVSDSILFPLVAFAAIDPGLTATQAAAKFAGGILWSGVYLAALRYTRPRSNADVRSANA